MLTRYPDSNRRRASELYRELEAIASVLLPEWQGAELEGQFGSALLRIAAQLGGHVTSRIDATPRRDVLAFFEMLDVPFDGPRPAQAPLVFLLSEKHEDPVFAPAASQVAASSDDGEILFETLSALQLAPGRLHFLASADGDSDRIEEAPPGFLNLATPPQAVPELRAASFAQAGSSTLQVELGEGLAVGEVIRIDGTVYRIAEAKDGLLRLKDSLESDVSESVLIEKVSWFDPFDFRDLQAHILYVGHAELLTLEEPSTIEVLFDPQGVAQRLIDLDVIWELFGTNEQEPDESNQQDWHRLTSSPGGSGEIVLRKEWAGSVDETEVNGLGSRWLRARYPTEVSTARLSDTKTTEIRLRVETLVETTTTSITTAHGACGNRKAVTTNEQPGASDSEAVGADPCEGGEGSQTIDQAFHNATPLPLTTRFLPFGPEPLRFDTFALAAPEALSKASARVTLNVRLPDATIQSVELAQSTDGPHRAYGVAANGRLQGLGFDDDRIEWRELDHPELTDAKGEDVQPRDLRLDEAVAPQAIQLSPASTHTDLIVALDRRGRPWATRTLVGTTRDGGFERLAWRELPEIPGNGGSRDLLLQRASRAVRPPFAAMLMAVGNGELQVLKLAADGSPVGEWKELSRVRNEVGPEADGVPTDEWKEISRAHHEVGPELAEDSRLVPVVSAPASTPLIGFPVEVAVADQQGALWRAEITDDRQAVRWESVLDDPECAATLAVRPAAERRDGNLIVFAARKDGEVLQPFVVLDTVPTTPFDPFAVAPGSSLHLLRGTHHQEPLVVAFGTQDGAPSIALLTHIETSRAIELPQDIGLASPPSGFLLSESGALTLVAAGTAETLHREPLAEEVDIEISRALGRDGDPPSVSVLRQAVAIDTGNWRTAKYERGYQNPELAWEYFDGDSWRSLEGIVDHTNDFARSGDIVFEVPDDLAPGEVAGQEDLWVRARLVGGDYGRAKYIVTSGKELNDTTTQTVTVDTSSLLPPEILCMEASFVLENSATPQLVLVQNNLDFRDQTQANQVPNVGFELFEGVRKVNELGAQRVLYFGFTKPFDVSPLSIFVDAEDQEGTVELDFEVLAGDRWRHVSADDETRGFHRRGFVQISVDVEPRKAARFGQDLHWLRARPRSGESSETWEPRLLGVFVNAGLAEQARTVEQELLGSSLGEPGLRLTLGNQPVLPDSLELRVRETLSDEERNDLNRDQDGRVARYPELSLRGDWVLWERVDSFVEHDSDARVFRLDAVSGEVTFGARTPPAGADGIRAIRYQTGGGGSGNVEAFEIKSLKSAVEAVDKVANPVPAVGGNDAETVDAELERAPARLRRARQALTPPDFEALAVSTSPDVVRARCLFPESPGAPIRVAVAVRTGERCPKPSLAQREELARTLREQAWGGLSQDDLEVIVPEYVRTRLTTRLRAVSTDQAAALEQAAVTTLRLLMHPVAVGAGPAGHGWPFARPVYESDVLRALATLPGFDRVEELDLSPVDGTQRFEEMSPLSLICAETTDIEVTVEVGDQGT